MLCVPCARKASPEHVFSVCKVALEQDRITWQHNKEMKEFGHVAGEYRCWVKGRPDSLSKDGKIS